MLRINRILILSVVFFTLGLFLSTVSYQSLEPALITTFFTIIISTVSFFIIKQKGEFYFYFFCFLIFVFLGGFASIFNNLFESIDNDEEFFYLSAIGNRQYLDSIIENFDGYGAVSFWAFFYDLFSELGFSKIPHIGITINILLMTFSGALIFKSALKIYSEEADRANRLFYLYPFNGLILLFALTHLRDAFSFFLISLLLFSWISLIKNRQFLNFLGLILTNLICIFSFNYIRPEFLLIPLALILSFFVSIVFVGEKNNPFYFRGIKSLGIVIVISGSIVLFQSGIINFVDEAYQAYILLNQSLQNSSSLGTTLIVEAPLPIRLVLGSIYLYVFPIPFWAELDYRSLYHFFKFLNLIYFYFFVPLMILSIYYFFKLKIYRSLINYFLLLSIVGFTVSVALTSLETRHLGQFLPFLMLFSLIPPFKDKIEYLNYYKIFLFYISGILLVHILWIYLKL
tara:strand:- start:404 stop:1774 length:1371 start_codon:yes stop_codon:yes gene_type:complete